MLKGEEMKEFLLRDRSDATMHLERGLFRRKTHYEGHPFTRPQKR